MKRILIISLLLILVILSLSAVTAQENTTDTIDIAQTQDASDEILTEDENDEWIRENASDEILTEEVPKEVLKDDNILFVEVAEEYLRGVDIDNTYLWVDFEYALTDVEIYIDNEYYGKYWLYDWAGMPFSPGAYELGEHVVTAKYDGVYGHYIANATFNVVNLILGIPNEMNINYPKNVVIESGNLAGNVTIYINGSEYKTVNFTKFSTELVPLDNLKVGTYEIKLVYLGNEYEPGKNKTTILNIIYSFTLIDDHNDNYNYTAIISLPKDINNTPIATIEGETYPFEKTTSNSEFKVNVDLTKVSTGTHLINITYPGDDKYPQKSIIKEINVKRESIPPYDETTNTINITVEYGMPIVLTFGSEDEKNIIYEYSYYNAFGEGIYGTGNKPVLEFNSSGLGAIGDYTINVNVTNKYLFEKELVYNIQIIQASTNITANVEDINCTEIATINIIGSVDGTAIVKIDENNTKTINITKNTTTPVTFENLTAGTHSVSVVLKPSNDNYNESTCNTEFKVSKKQAAINIACEEKIVEGSTLTVNITIPNATGKVKVNGKETNLVNGKATVELTDLALGDNTITAIYNGDDIYTNATASSKVNVYPKADANLKVSASDIQVGETAVINIEINAKTTGDVTVDGKKVTVNNGKATYSITDLKEGNYKVIVKFAGDKYYKQAEKTVAFKVNALPSIEPKIVSKNITTVLYTAKGKYTVTVYGKDGKPANGTEVIFEIKGKQDKKTTDSNGVAKYTVTRTPGTYDITTTALGVSITKTLKVKHLVTLKKVTPKKSAKKLTLQATLAKVNGKYLKGKTITFKFNGKKYKAKTNSKGIAKYTIKSTILKKLKVGKKITYQATYLKDTVKQTVKVKK